MYLNSATTACGWRSSAWNRAQHLRRFCVAVQAPQREEPAIVRAAKQRLRARRRGDASRAPRPVPRSDGVVPRNTRRTHPADRRWPRRSAAAAPRPHVRRAPTAVQACSGRGEPRRCREQLAQERLRPRAGRLRAGDSSTRSARFKRASGQSGAADWMAANASTAALKSNCPIRPTARLFRSTSSGRDGGAGRRRRPARRQRTRLRSAVRVPATSIRTRSSVGQHRILYATLRTLERS